MPDNTTPATDATATPAPSLSGPKAEAKAGATGQSGEQAGASGEAARACYMSHISTLGVLEPDSHAPREAFWDPLTPDLAAVQAAAAAIPGTAEDATHRLVIGPGVVSTGVRGYWDRLADEIGAEDAAWEKAVRQACRAKDPDQKKRGIIRGWSSSSRASMVRTLAELDYSGLLTADRFPVMLTLTLPGDWVTVAPDSATYKKLAERFKSRWQRKWGAPISGVWKQEYQRRGAPHTHILTVIPPRAVGFTQWLGDTWADVCAHPDPEERERHRLAGTGVDTATGLRSRDPKRIAVYFSKHGSYGDKAYQDRPPDEWTGSTGRPWGYWGLQKATQEVEITEWEAIQVQRVVRRWQHAQAVRVQRPVRRLARPQKINPDTGDVLREARWRVRKSGVRMGEKRHIGADGAGFQIVNDGPGMAVQLGRYVQKLRTGEAG